MNITTNLNPKDDKRPARGSPRRAFSGEEKAWRNADLFPVAGIPARPIRLQDFATSRKSPPLFGRGARVLVKLFLPSCTGERLCNYLRTKLFPAASRFSRSL